MEKTDLEEELFKALDIFEAYKPGKLPPRPGDFELNNLSAGPNQPTSLLLHVREPNSSSIQEQKSVSYYPRVRIGPAQPG